jgi:hypothetical protein
MARPIAPYSYRSASFRNFQDDLAYALECHIKQKKLTAADISKLYPSVRDSHIRKIRAGNGVSLGMKMLFSIAEASGLQAKLEVSA